MVTARVERVVACGAASSPGSARRASSLVAPQVSTQGLERVGRRGHQRQYHKTEEDPTCCRLLGYENKVHRLTH